MSDRMFPWVVRTLWAIVPFTTGAALGSALHPEAHPLRLWLSVGAWMVWLVVLVAILVPHPVGLTVFRCVAPALAVTAAVSAGSRRPDLVASLVGLGVGALIAVVALLPATGIWFVNGPAYPNERRFPLSPPGPLLLGPLELAWAVLIGAPVVAVVLLASGRLALGAVASLITVASTWFLGRALHGLSRRWAVFVPAGLVLHDPASLLDPVLFGRQVIEALGPAPAGSDSLDLTQRAMGLALELRLREKVPMTRVTPGRGGREPGASARLLFTPTRPGAVMTEAAARHLPIRRPGPLDRETTTG